MPMEQEPVVGAIYKDLDGKSFEVLAFNEDDGVIDVQYVDGAVEEIDLDAWYEMDLVTVKTPKDEDEEDDDDELDDEDDEDLDDEDEDDEDDE